MLTLVGISIESHSFLGHAEHTESMRLMEVAYE